jgi:hypothetical protein
MGAELYFMFAKMTVIILYFQGFAMIMLLHEQAACQETKHKNFGTLVCS